jgi:rod shape-determining protein mreD
MFNVILPRVLWIIGLILAHTLVFNHIHLMGYATPMPYVYALIILPHGTARWIYVVLGFCIGIVIDILSNTVGAAAAALTLVGLLTPLLLRTFAPDDKLEEEFTPSIKTMQWGGFLKLAVAVTFIHTLVFFLLETFSLFDALEILIKVGSSTALTVIFMMTFEKLRNTSRNT